MYDLHCHTLQSDGVLLPSEVAVRYSAAGYKAIAICDHADYSNAGQIIDSILLFQNADEDLVCFRSVFPPCFVVHAQPGIHHILRPHLDMLVHPDRHEEIISKGSLS